LILTMAEEGALPGTDERGARLRPAGARGTAPPESSRAEVDGEPIADAPGWRVVRRAAPMAGRATATSDWAERMGLSERITSEHLEPPASALEVPLRPALTATRRVAVRGRRGRGISLLALAAAIVVVLILGLVLVRAQRLEWAGDRALGWAAGLAGSRVVGAIAQLPGPAPLGQSEPADAAAPAAPAAVDGETKPLQALDALIAEWNQRPDPTRAPGAAAPPAGAAPATGRADRRP
jgi:hypothetical protein